MLSSASERMVVGVHVSVGEENIFKLEIKWEMVFVMFPLEVEKNCIFLNQICHRNFVHLQNLLIK